MAPTTKETTKEAPKPEVKSVPSADNKLYPVRLLKNIRPDTYFRILEQTDPEDEYSDWKEREAVGEKEVLDDGIITKVAVGEYKKVWAGTVILLPKEKARQLLKSRIAERHDDL